MLSYGFSNILWKKLDDNLTSYYWIFYRSLISVGIFTVLYSLGSVFGLDIDWLQTSFIGFSQWSTQDLFLCVLLCCFSFFGLYFYNQAIRVKAVGKTIITVSTSAVFGVTIGVFVFNDTFYFAYLISLFLFIAAVYLIANDGNGFAKRINKGTVYALLAAFFWGISFALLPYFSRKYGALPTSLLLEICVLITAGAFAGKEVLKSVNKPWKTLFLLGFFAAAGGLLFNTSMRFADVAVLSVLGAMSPVFGVLLSRLVLKEKQGLKLIISLMLCLCALVLLRVKPF